MLTKQAAIEWAEFGIRVNAVAPRGCLTDMVKDMLDTPEKMAMATSQIPMRRLNQQPHAESERAKIPAIQNREHSITYCIINNILIKLKKTSRPFNFMN